MSMDRPTLSELASAPALTSEIELEHIPELLGDMERLRATLWARLALRISRPVPTEDYLVVAADAASRLGVSQLAAFVAFIASRRPPLTGAPEALPVVRTLVAIQRSLRPGGREERVA